MSRIFYPPFLISLAVLGGCATPDPVVVPQASAGPAIVPAPGPIRSGFGRIEAIASMPASAAAGGTAQPLKRISIKMEDGTYQYVDHPAEGLSLGDRVELTSDGQIRP